MKQIFAILVLFMIGLVFADTITLKTGLKIQGNVIAIESDTVTIQTKTGVLKIPAAEIKEISFEEKEKTEEVPLEKEERLLNDQAIPRSIKQVGCGCLGGLVGGSVAGILAVATDGFGFDPYATTTIVLGSVILGVLIGFAAGGG
ncbi:MAG: hypothetical protein JSW02_04170 [candidate division WOR-3 bacterium]|nr:MAG: hypothetical protein JSW02_04170 [candidate division WOR-3 bacterium]